ncbi:MULTISPECIES: ABC transporter permease [Curtobacterium]|jgi:peptide/nickel transport system permease protein|uniref:ABC transporter permease n=1 Tax=Curtobacterium TaxID=2034 RepID=UPI000D855D2F|nr:MULTISPECIES: ABC transporter permease [Curtobacterium]MBT1607718.1 ABC transporter permease [Curtobacterium flaccumfaciens pv. betae]MBT1630919.1 ABC transporter permease [Curtobacterium flaccumfaciens pv. oortii]MBT1657807.1 ABC transporter permease [Curtobacterium flaccumfaciens pv. betae]MBT1669839.1 ABC transporter permease [Curtobacterium flaccumfaciens pv. flaccumfaciens]MCS0471504.1 ABC transporter permease [Curtobacterium flaccumfaciens pv. betae]
MTNNATIAVRTQDTEEQAAPSKWRAAARQFGVVWSNKKARIGIIILGVFVFVAVFAPLLAPYGASQNGFARSADATPDHWMGTTAAGEDVLSQIIYGARISVMVGAVAGILSTLVAVAIGLSWGYVRGWIAEVIGFIVNLFLVIPGLPLMIVIAAYLQNGGIAVIIAVIVVTGWAWGARVLRSQTQSLRGRDFVTAAQFSGEGATRIVFREILPNMTSLIVGSFFGAATSAILAEAGLEFLGLGDSSIVSWGTILYWAQNSNALLTGQWILLFAPGLCIALLAMSLTLINFGVDAVSNPRLRDGARPRKEKRA